MKSPHYCIVYIMLIDVVKVSLLHSVTIVFIETLVAAHGSDNEMTSSSAQPGNYPQEIHHHHHHYNLRIEVTTAAIQHRLEEFVPDTDDFASKLFNINIKISCDPLQILSLNMHLILCVWWTQRHYLLFSYKMVYCHDMTWNSCSCKQSLIVKKYSLYTSSCCVLVKKDMKNFYYV